MLSFPGWIGKGLGADMTKPPERAPQEIQGLTDPDSEGIPLARQRDAQIEAGEMNALTPEEFGRLTQ
jgi:hypothetical protein